jgi:hypothetical protein
MLNINLEPRLPLDIAEWNPKFSSREKLRATAELIASFPVDFLPGCSLGPLLGGAPASGGLPGGHGQF